MSKKVLILGVNGFIGNSLTLNILNTTDWEVCGMDLGANKLEHCLGHERFHFFQGDITRHQSWIDRHVSECDVVVPLVAIATPALYVQEPIKVFELDFEANMAIVRMCVKHRKRLVFPSTSEIYGMSEDEELSESDTNFVLGPIHKQRWIYSNIKQLLDRVIYAYGEKEDLDYTLFRPFNFVGPKLDDINDPKEGSSRVVTQFIHNIINGQPIKLVDGGNQRRSFTFIEDGIDCIKRIIANEDGVASKRIFNIGNPDMDFSIKELAETLLELVSEYKGYEDVVERISVIEVDSEEYYGKAYQDIQKRVPSISEAKKYLGWEPQVDLRTGLRLTLDYHLEKLDYNLNSLLTQ
jgi:nucleoside-diphosphate-sugar epimerase